MKIINYLREVKNIMSKVNIPEYEIFDMVCKAERLCLASSYITDNYMYAQVANRIQYNYSDKPVLNSWAYFTYDEEKGFTGMDDLIPAVDTFAGLSLYMSLFAAIFTEYHNDRNSRHAIKAGLWIVDNLVIDYTYEGMKMRGLDVDRIHEFYEKFPKYSNKTHFDAYKELTIKMILGVIAHETGHHCLGHLYTGGVDNTTSRNREREADSFSCSVCQGTGLGSSFVLAEMLTELGFYFMKKGKLEKTGTHPDSEERIMNMYRSFQNEINYAGFTLDDIKKLMRF